MGEAPPQAADRSNAAIDRHARTQVLVFSAQSRIAELKEVVDSLRARLGELAKQLDPACFVRIHRSEIVRRDLVAAVRRKQSGRSVVVMPDGRELPISRRYLATIVRVLRGRRLPAA